jgi:hypothetical protein
VIDENVCPVKKQNEEYVQILFEEIHWSSIDGTFNGGGE